MQPMRLPLVELSYPLSAAETATDRYRQMLYTALREEKKPSAIDLQGLRTAPMRLTEALHSKIEELSQASGLDFKTVFASLCTQGQDLMDATRAEVATAVLPKVIPPLDESRFKSPQQATFFRGLQEGLDGCKIVIAEGSTGIGKSRSMAMAAIEQSKQGKTPVVLAAPSLAVMAHLYSEFAALPASDTEGHMPRLLVGAAEFVDDESLRMYLDRAATDQEMPVDEGVRMWVANGAPALDRTTASSLALGEGACWLMEDLRSLCDLMDPHDFMLMDEVDNAERSVSRANVAAMRARAAQETQSVVLCSHMMLAAAQRTQWKTALGAPEVVLIDEAHLFEAAVTAVNTERFSTFTARIALRKHISEHGDSTAAKKALKSVETLAAAIQEGLKGNMALDGGPKAAALDSSLRSTLLQAVLECHKTLASNKISQLRLRDHFLMALRDLGRSLNGESMNLLRLERSAVRGYPSLYTGPSTVAMQLGDIWKTAAGGVALVSATLYAMDAEGEYRCDYIRRVLNLPLQRCSTPAPVRDRSITDLPTLYTVGEKRFAQFIPPPEKDADDKEAMSAWIGTLAAEITRIDAQARGGTLVLLTSYATLTELAEQLQPTLGDRLVQQSPGRKLQTYLNQYRGLYSQQIKPVLLGVGSAWTGVDLSDPSVEPHEDYLLTDVVITRLPINLNTSLTQKSRMDGMGLYPLVNEALLTFKQGLGRLIRRDRVEHRKLWILDGRIHPKFIWPGMQKLTAGVRRMLREYAHRREI